MTSLYQFYLAADLLQRRFDALEAKHHGLTLASPEWLDRAADEFEGSDLTYGFMHHVSTSVSGLYDPEKVEAFAARWLELWPSTQVVRDRGRIFLRGQTGGFLKLWWHVEVGMGVCERVQVGTRRVLRPAADAPMVEVDEPIYEVRCVDPLATVVAS